jgi:hypothetical protein
MLDVVEFNPNGGLHVYYSPLLFALEQSRSFPENRCWKLLLEHGADPTKFVFKNTSPMLYAIEQRMIEFVREVFGVDRCLADPLAQYDCKQNENVMRMMRWSTSFKTNKDRVATKYSILKRVFEEGWGEGAFVVLRAAVKKPEFDIDMLWSGDYPEPPGDSEIDTYQKADARHAGDNVGPHAPQSLLYRAAFHHMHQALETLIDLYIEKYPRCPLSCNLDGHTLVHAVIFGAAAATRRQRFSGRPLADGEAASEARSCGHTLDLVLDMFLKEFVDFNTPDMYGRSPKNILSKANIGEFPFIAPSLVQALKVSFSGHSRRVQNLRVVERGHPRLPGDALEIIRRRQTRW